jgi:hypothetical protein
MFMCLYFLNYTLETKRKPVVDQSRKQSVYKRMKKKKRQINGCLVIRNEHRASHVLNVCNLFDQKNVNLGIFYCQRHFKKTKLETRPTKSQLYIT